LIGFLLGLISGLLSETLKRRQEKQRLINLFRAELMRTHMEIDSKQQVPVGEVFSRGKYELFGIRDVEFSGAPEYELEVYNARLFETEGVRLAQQLGPHARQSFWAAFGYLRDAEAIRLVLRSFPKGEHDYQEYQRVFVALIRKSSDALAELWKALEHERSFIETLRDLWKS
jgi:hypothetical protein